MLNCASLCCILIHKFECMYALSIYLTNFGCHFLPLWKIFQFTWTALRAAARINFVHNLLFSLFIFPVLFSFFREFCACCPVCTGVVTFSRMTLSSKTLWHNLCNSINSHSTLNTLCVRLSTLRTVLIGDHPTHNCQIFIGGYFQPDHRL